MRIVVIGAGVVGAAIADALARRGAETTVLDMRAPGAGASQASAGLLAPFIEAHDNTTFLSLCRRSLDLYDDFVAGVRERAGLAVEYARTGTLEVALSDADADRLRAARAWLDTVDVAHEWIDGAELSGVEPAVSSTATGALLVPKQGFVGAMSLVRALVQSARMAGASFVSPVEAAEVDVSGGRAMVKAGDRRFAADAVVLAAGSWSSRVRVRGANVPPVHPVRGQLLHLDWSAGAERPSRPIWGARCYTVPWSDGSLLVGATVEDVGFDESSTVAGVHDLTEAVGELLPRAWQASVNAVRVGLRPASPDGLPFIGPLSGAPNVVAATGHYRNGVLLAPITAAMVTDYLLDRRLDPEFQAAVSCSRELPRG